VDWMHLACSCEHGNEPSGFVKGGREEFFDYLSLKEDSAPWS